MATVIPNQAYLVMLPSAPVHNCLPACIKTEYQDVWGRYTQYIFVESTNGTSGSSTDVCDWGDSEIYKDKVVVFRHVAHPQWVVI